jgi:outer membrane lipoprotein-sorting protein
MSIKNIAIIAIIITSITLSFGANKKFSQIFEKYTDTPVEIDFEQKTYWAVREKETKIKGKIIIAPENKFNISAGKMNYISNGETFWEYNNRQKQVSIKKITAGISKNIPTELLNLLKSAEFVEKTAQSAVWQDENTRENGFEKVEITHENSLISNIIITDTDKNITTYTFEKVVFLKTVDNGLFNFVIPDGAQVYDENN